MNYLLGLDIGTSHIKAVITDLNGNEVAFAVRPSMFVPFGEHLALMPESLWENVRDLIVRAVQQLEDNTHADRSQIKGVAVASMGEMGVPIGENGALYPAISWYDLCTVPHTQRLREQIGDARILDVLGQRLLHIFTITKLMWLKESEPQIYKNMKTWCCIADYIAYRLCGNIVMDYSIAARTGMLDYKNRQWDAGILDIAGIEINKLPPLTQSGSLVGEIDQQTAMAIGLCKGTKVYAGGHDHICGALACGVIKPGIFLDSSGTAEAIITAESSVPALEMAGRKGFNVGPHTADFTYYAMGGILTSGAAVDWYHNTFKADLNVKSGKIGSLTFLPHLRGSSSPTRNSNSRGAFIGLLDVHTKDDLMQAVYEGLGFELKDCMLQLIDQGAIKRIACIGGGTKNKAWLQTKANALGCALEVPSIKESTAMGAALLAGIGSGFFNDAQDAFEKTYHVEEIIEPDRAMESYYEEKFQIYKTLYNVMLETNMALSALNDKC